MNDYHLFFRPGFTDNEQINFPQKTLIKSIRKKILNMNIISFVDDLNINTSSTSMEILQNISGHLGLNFLDPDINKYYFAKDDIEICRVKSLNRSHVRYPNISYDGLKGTELQLVEFISTQGGLPDLTARITDSPISICQLYFNYIGVQMDEMSSLDILDITYTEGSNSCSYSGEWILHNSFPIAHGKGILTKRILYEGENIEITYDGDWEYGFEHGEGEYIVRTEEDGAKVVRKGRWIRGEEYGSYEEKITGPRRHGEFFWGVVYDDETENIVEHSENPDYARYTHVEVNAFAKRESLIKSMSREELTMKITVLDNKIKFLEKELFDIKSQVQTNDN
jgi:hypothetical protein